MMGVSDLTRAFCIMMVLLPMTSLAKCPRGCICENKFVDCSAILVFPDRLDADTERVRISHMITHEVPKNVFSYLKNITTIEIQNSNMGKIAKCAFTGLPRVRKIVFDTMVIGSIESYAFWGLSHVTQIEIRASRVGRVKSFGFFDINKLDTLKVLDTRMEYIYTSAFSNMTNVNNIIFTGNNISDIAPLAFTHVNNVDRMVVTQNTLWHLGCGVLDTILTMASQNTFTRNTMFCNCSLAGIINAEGMKKYREVIPDVKCHGPVHLKSKSSIWQMLFIDIGCRNTDIRTQVPECSDIPLVPSLDCSPYARPDIPGDSVEDDVVWGNGAEHVTSAIALMLLSTIVHVQLL